MIIKLFDYQNASDCFNSVEIKGGVSYFLWDSSYCGKCYVTTNDGKGNITTIYRPLLEMDMETFIRDGNMITLLYKVKAFHEDQFSNIVSANDPFGFDTREEHSSKRVKVPFAKSKSNSSIPIYYNGWRTEGVKYVDIDLVKRNLNAINKFKIFVPKAWGIGNPLKDNLNSFIPENNAVCTETYLMVGPFDTYQEMLNCYKYMHTRFFHLMVSLIKSTQNTMQKAYAAVPLQDFSANSSINWDVSCDEIDQVLYAKYGFSDQEVAYIESAISAVDQGV